MRLLVLIAGLGLVPVAAVPTPTPISFSAAGGVTVRGDSYAAYARTAPVLLLFHEANATKAEYAVLGPRFAALGYNAIAIDLRSGQAALADMEAALAFAKGAHPISKIVAIGSSFSAALVFALAAKHPHDLTAIAAFSPAEYFANPQYVRTAARRVRLPTFIDSASAPQEVAKAREIYAAVASSVKQQYVPHAGVHGAATLRDDRNPVGADENFRALVAFLERSCR